ncbi:hypothetical protein [Streptomyces sp. NPDC001492]
MNEYNDPNHAFDGIVNHSFQANPQANAPQASYTDPHPYGPPAHGRPVKTGLTPRGKAGIAVITAVLAGGGLLGYQHYAATQAANEVKAKELAIQQAQIDLQRQKALDKASKEAAKTVSVQETARQKQIDACVQDNKQLVGKQLGQTLAGVISDCQNQYPATSTATGNDLQETASSQPTSSGGGAGEGLLIGAGVLVIGTILFVRKATKPAPQAAPNGYVIYPNPYQQ